MERPPITQNIIRTLNDESEPQVVKIILREALKLHPIEGYYAMETVLSLLKERAAEARSNYANTR